MDPLSNEDDQLRALKKWWSDNGTSTVLGIVLAVSAVVGWRSWQAQQEARAEAAALAYQAMVEKVAEAGQQPDDLSIAAAMHQADQIKEQFGGTGYAHFAALAKARQAVVDEDYELAEQELRWVIAETPSAQLREVARLRLARVLLSAGKNDQALDALALEAAPAEPDANGFAAQKAELAGDIYMLKGEYQVALEHYNRAESLTAAGATRLPLLAVKLGYAKSQL